MSRLTKTQEEEIARCAVDFTYFCEHYVKILVYGPAAAINNTAIVPFKLHPYQERLYEHLEGNRFTIFSKFRQGGFTTELAIYALWRCLFRLDQNILWMAKTDREAVDVCDRIVKRALEYLPDWMKGSVLKMTNSHQKNFPDTGSSMFFGTPQAACAKAASLLIIDEASCIQDMDQHWKAMWPVVSAGGNVCVMSTPHTDEDWFWTQMENATLKLNNFSIYHCKYNERPEYATPEWETQMKGQLGQIGWNTEVEQKPIIMSERHLAYEHKKPSKKLWRSVFDDWGSSHHEEGEAE